MEILRKSRPILKLSHQNVFLKRKSDTCRPTVQIILDHNSYIICNKNNIIQLGRC